MKLATFVSLAALMATTPAMAWTAQTAGHGPQAIGQDGGQAQAQQATSRSRSSSTSTASGYGVGTGGAGGQSNAVGNGGSVAIGSVGTGANSGILGSLSVPDGHGDAPCGGGLGLGGLGLGGGGSGGGTLWEFGDCKRMRESHALRSIAAEVSNPQVRAQLEQGALNELCQIDRVKDAFGGRCPTLAMLDLDTQAGKFDYCFTRDAGDLNQHRECDRIIKHY